MKHVLTLSLFLMAVTISAQTSIEGTWNIGKENTIINIIDTDGTLSATFVSSDNNKLEMGALFLKEVTSDGEGWKGKLYNVKKEKWYNVKFKLKNETIEAKVKAGIISKTLTWTRI